MIGHPLEEVRFPLRFRTGHAESLSVVRRVRSLRFVVNIPTERENRSFGPLPFTTLREILTTQRPESQGLG